MTALDPISKSFEERFDPKLRTIDESHIKNFDKQKIKKKYSTFFKIEFCPSIPKETILFLKSKIPALLDFPDKFGLVNVYTNHSIRFIDQNTYEKETGKNLPENIRLPASSLKINSSQIKYEITIIIPKLIDTLEILVNITRNIFSKLYGDIFFIEHIIPLDFYQVNSNHKKEIFTSIPEILNLINELNFSSKILEPKNNNYIKSHTINQRNQFDDFQKNQIKEWIKKWEEKLLTLNEKNIIEDIFSEFIKEFENNPEYFFKLIKKRIKILNEETNFILPHEISAYLNFEEKRFLHYIQIVKNKLEEINTLSELIIEIESLLKNNSKIDDLGMIDMLISSCIKKMDKEKKILKFFFSEKKYRSDLKGKINLFLIKMIPRGTEFKDWAKEVKKIENQYTKSIYYKIYSSLISLKKLISIIKDSKNITSNQKKDREKLKNLLTSIKYRINSLKGLQKSIGLFLEINQNISPKLYNESNRHYVPLDDFGRAWSYFISSILTMLYFKDSSPPERLQKEFNSDNYINSIINFIERKCYLGINYFHIVKLLWLLYIKNKKNRLNFVIFCIRQPQNILRFVLHELMLPEIKKENINFRIEKIPNFTNALLSVYEKRFNEEH